MLFYRYFWRKTSTAKSFRVQIFASARFYGIIQKITIYNWWFIYLEHGNIRFWVDEMDEEDWLSHPICRSHYQFAKHTTTRSTIPTKVCWIRPDFELQISVKRAKFNLLIDYNPYVSNWFQPVRFETRPDISSKIHISNQRALKAAYVHEFSSKNINR